MVYRLFVDGRPPETTKPPVGFGCKPVQTAFYISAANPFDKERLFYRKLV
ncbi:hypothetical protein NEILACOT_03626 [Neisseria lactamica ATCC 23970]|uniref:Uncharacterized protein n=1 Tax=Neisseria lactamica ATCC 23970 TaxID=546265 RepID=D0W7X5_NEILA|nr:hypothetical protein NEILACOT_03626 [Neisseria lactamica ATCC 23970]